MLGLEYIAHPAAAKVVAEVAADVAARSERCSGWRSATGSVICGSVRSP